MQVQEAAPEPKTPAIHKLIINNHKSEMIYLSLYFLPAFFQLKQLFPFCLFMWNRHKRHPLHPAHGNEDSTKCPEREIRSSIKTAAPARIAFHCGHPTLPSSRSLWTRFGISWKTIPVRVNTPVSVLSETVSGSDWRAESGVLCPAVDCGDQGWRPPGISLAFIMLFEVH